MHIGASNITAAVYETIRHFVARVSNIYQHRDCEFPLFQLAATDINKIAKFNIAVSWSIRAAIKHNNMVQYLHCSGSAQSLLSRQRWGAFQRCQ